MITTSVLVVLVVFVDAGHTQECLTGIEGGPPWPTFPNQLSADVEVVIVHLNLTVHVTEYFDSIKSRGRFESYSKFGSNVMLFNSDAKEILHIVAETEGRKKCRATPLTTESPHFPPLIGGHFMMFRAKQAYIGMEIVDGVLCYRWQVCNISIGDEKNYNIDYYFTQNNWTFNPVFVPFQVVINSTQFSTDTSDGPIHQEHLVYSYVNFRSGPVDDELFHVPPGLSCFGKDASKPLPPLPKDYFTLLYEFGDPINKEILYYRVS